MSDKTFISYARTDSEFALRLAHDLRAANVDVWLDQLDIRAGDTWDRAIEDALEECSNLLVVLSPSSVDSRSVMDEVSFALEENKSVIPVVYRECRLPFRLRRVQFTDFTSDYARGLSGLIRLLGGTPPAAGEVHSHADAGPPDRTERTERPPAHLVPRRLRQRWNKVYRALRQDRLATSLALSLWGGLLVGGVVAIEYSDLAEGVGAGSFAGVLWAVAGAIAGPRRIPLWGALAAALVSYALMVVFLDDLDKFVVALFLCPAGGIVGATIGVFVARHRRLRRDAK